MCHRRRINTPEVARSMCWSTFSNIRSNHVSTTTSTQEMNPQPVSLPPLLSLPQDASVPIAYLSGNFCTFLKLNTISIISSSLVLHMLTSSILLLIIVSVTFLLKDCSASLFSSSISTFTSVHKQLLNIFFQLLQTHIWSSSTISHPAPCP